MSPRKQFQTELMRSLSPNSNKEVKRIIKTRKLKVKNILIKYSDSECEMSESESLADRIENDIKSNLKELFYEEEIADILVDNERSAKANQEFLKECCNLGRIVGKESLIKYLKSLAITKQDPHVVAMVEKAFGSELKELLIKQELADTENKFRMWNARLRKEWNELSTVIDEIDLLRYSCPIVKPYRK